VSRESIGSHPFCPAKEFRFGKAINGNQITCMATVTRVSCMIKENSSDLKDNLETIDNVSLSPKLMGYIRKEAICKIKKRKSSDICATVEKDLSRTFFQTT